MDRSGVHTSVGLHHIEVLQVELFANPGVVSEVVHSKAHHLQTCRANTHVRHWWQSCCCLCTMISILPQGFSEWHSWSRCFWTKVCKNIWHSSGLSPEGWGLSDLFVVLLENVKLESFVVLIIGRSGHFFFTPLSISRTPDCSHGPLNKATKLRTACTWDQKRELLERASDITPRLI